MCWGECGGGGVSGGQSKVKKLNGSADSDEMACYKLSHLDLYCLGR